VCYRISGDSRLGGQIADMTLLAWRRPDEDRSHQSRQIAQSDMLTQSAPDQTNDKKLQYLIPQLNPRAALRVRSKVSA
jgi:hypothetical protein